MKFFIKNNKGLTIIEILLGSVILTASIFALGSFATFFAGQEAAHRRSKNLTDFKAELFDTLSHQQSWQMMIVKANTPHPYLPSVINSELQCLRDHVACTEGEFSLTVLDSVGKIIADATDLTTGVNERGETCSGFSLDSLEAATKCPFRFNLSWSALCPLGQVSCLNPQIQIKMAMAKNAHVKQNINAASFNMQVFVDNAGISTATALQKVILTNSTALGLGASHIDYDLKNSVFYLFNKSSLSFSIPSGVTAAGGVASVSGSVLSYDPAPNFYGLDQIDYQVTDVSGKVSQSKIWIRVMTPHTWIGLAGGGNLKTSTLANFCGVVINGVCDNATFPAGNKDRHFIFNENCTNCLAQLDTDAHSIEMAPAFIGTVVLEKDSKIGSWAGNSWVKFPIFHQKGGTFKVASSPLNLTVSIDSVPWGYPRAVGDKALKLENGVFEAPELLALTGPAVIQLGGGFVHNSGTVQFCGFGGQSKGTTLTAPAVAFWNLYLKPTSDCNTSGRVFTDSFSVKNNMDFNLNGIEDNLGSPLFGIDLDPSVVVQVFGNITMTGSGGSFCNDNCAALVIELAGSASQVITGPNVAWTTPIEVAERTPYLPYLRINKSGGTVKFKDYIGFRKGFEMVSATPVDTTGTSVVFGNNWGESRLKLNGTELNNLFFSQSGAGLFVDDSQIVVRGNFYHFPSGWSKIYGQVMAPNPTVMKLYGDFHLNDQLTDVNGTPVREIELQMVADSDQNIIGTVGEPGPAEVAIVIDKTAGTVRLQNKIGIQRGFWIKNGTVVQDPTSTFAVSPYNGSYAKITVPAAFKFENLEVSNTVTLGSDIKTKNLNLGTHSVFLIPPSFFSTGAPRTISVDNNLNLDYDVTGDAYTLEMVGAGAQELTVKSGLTLSLGNGDLRVNKPSGSLNVKGELAAASFNLIAGTVDMTSTNFNVTNSAASTAGTIINKNGATITASSTSFLGVVNP